MIEQVRFVSGLCVIITLLAPVSAVAQASAPGARDVVSELSRRSGLPESDLETLLADCNANQRSIYFCAYRDLVAADMTFKRALAAKEQSLPACKSAIDGKAARWERLRDNRCEQGATKEFGDGSMKPTAQALCAAAETHRMTKRVKKISGCGERQSQR
jgi:hypothetical protein